MIDIFDLSSQSIERQCRFLANSVLNRGEASFFLSDRPLRGHVNFTFLFFSNNEKSNSKLTSIDLSAPTQEFSKDKMTLSIVIYDSMALKKSTIKSVSDTCK